VRALPNELLEQAARAEAAGFDFITISDFHPWLFSHHHSPNAWSVLALAAQTSKSSSSRSSPARLIRYHPAIVAQKGGRANLESSPELRRRSPRRGRGTA